MGGRRIPHDLRLELRKRVLELHSSGLGYRRIQRVIKEEYDVDLSRSNISYWVRGSTYRRGRSITSQISPKKGKSPG